MLDTVKLIILLIINNFMHMDAQQLPSQQRVEKTFANTQFDLEPNLPFDETATKSIHASQPKSPLALSVKVLPATVSPSFLPMTTVVTPERTHMELSTYGMKSSNIKSENVNREILNDELSRAILVHPTTTTPTATILRSPSLSSQSSQTSLTNQKTKLSQLQQTLGTPKFSKSLSNANKPLPQMPPQSTLKITPIESDNLLPHKFPIKNSLIQNHSQLSAQLSSSSSPTSLSSSLSSSSSIPAIAHSFTASGNIQSRGTLPSSMRRFSANSLWFNDTLPSFDCSKDFQQIAVEFQRKFPAQTVRDIREKRLADVIKQRLIDCDHKSKNNHWQNMITLLGKIKISPSEEEGCSNGLVQERIACLNLLSYTCQFIRHDYTFRLIPARAIIQEARIIEDGASKCARVIRLIKKHNQPK